MAIKIEKSEVLLMVTFLLPSAELTFVKTFGTFAGGNGPPGGEYFRNFWVGMCCWDPGTLNLYQN